MSKHHPDRADQPLRIDRRAAPRIPILRPARIVREGASAGLTFARTADVSLGGALIEVTPPRKYDPGEAVRVAILGEAVVIDPRSMIDARVVRVEHAGPGRQRVAVRFDVPQALPAAA